MSSNPTFPNRTRTVLRLFLSEYFVLGLTVLVLFGFAPFAPALLSIQNLTDMAAYLLPLFILGMGLTVVMITGGIDLSVASILGLTSVIGARLMTSGTSTINALGCMVAAGAALGGINGLIITLLRLPPFMVTLASGMFVGGFAIWFTQSQAIYGLPPSFLFIGKGLTALIPTALAALVAHLLLARTIYGRWLYAAGQNPITARISGVPVRRITCAAYVASGTCAALASVILTSRMETGSPVFAREILLDIIGAVVVGGTSLFGGRGKIAWTLCGVLFLTALDNALNQLNLSHFTITMIKGGVILAAAVADVIRRKAAREVT